MNILAEWWKWLFKIVFMIVLHLVMLVLFIIVMCTKHLINTHSSVNSGKKVHNCMGEPSLTIRLRATGDLGVVPAAQPWYSKEDVKQSQVSPCSSPLPWDEKLQSQVYLGNLRFIQQLSFGLKETVAGSHWVILAAQSLLVWRRSPSLSVGRKRHWHFRLSLAILAWVETLAI